MVTCPIKWRAEAERLVLIGATNAEYLNLYGESISLDVMDDEERALVSRLRRRAQNRPMWTAFSNFAMNAVGEFYDRRGLSRKKASQTPVFRIALDLGNRLGIAEGKVAPP